jgi:hypothetical protein
MRSDEGKWIFLFKVLQSILKNGSRSIILNNSKVSFKMLFTLVCHVCHPWQILKSNKDMNLCDKKNTLTLSFSSVNLNWLKKSQCGIKKGEREREIKKLPTNP